eukprot:gene42360-56283_t
MNPFPVLWRRGALALLGTLVLGCAALRAYPPAPNYTIYGLVRDQVGATLSVDGAEIILLKDNVEIGRAPIFKDLRLDSNYELNIRIDQTRSSTRVYTNKAVAANGVYSLYVELNGEKFYPIEVAGTLRAGNGGERVRLDLEEARRKGTREGEGGGAAGAERDVAFRRDTAREDGDDGESHASLSNATIFVFHL